MSSEYIRAMRNRCLMLARLHPDESYFFMAVAIEWNARLRNRQC